MVMRVRVLLIQKFLSNFKNDYFYFLHETFLLSNVTCKTRNSFLLTVAFCNQYELNALYTRKPA